MPCRAGPAQGGAVRFCRLGCPFSRWHDVHRCLPAASCPAGRAGRPRGPQGGPCGPPWASCGPVFAPVGGGGPGVRRASQLRRYGSLSIRAASRIAEARDPGRENDEPAERAARQARRQIDRRPSPNRVSAAARLIPAPPDDSGAETQDLSRLPSALNPCLSLPKSQSTMPGRAASRTSGTPKMLRILAPPLAGSAGRLRRSSTRSAPASCTSLVFKQRRDTCLPSTTKSNS